MFPNAGQPRIPGTVTGDSFRWGSAAWCDSAFLWLAQCPDTQCGRAGDLKLTSCLLPQVLKGKPSVGWEVALGVETCRQSGRQRCPLGRSSVSCRSPWRSPLVGSRVSLVDRVCR